MSLIEIRTAAETAAAERIEQVISDLREGLGSLELQRELKLVLEESDVVFATILNRRRK
jgi:hypothetical protein